MAYKVKEALDHINRGEDKKIKVSFKKTPVYYIKSFSLMVIVLFFIMSFFVSAYRIPTGSMEKTLRVGDMLLVNKFYYGFRTPDWIGIPFTEMGFHIPWIKTPFFNPIKRGDVVVFKPPVNPDVHFVKRCVGIPGDTIVVRNKELYVNGKKFSLFYDSLEVDPSFKEGKPKARFIDFKTIPQGVLDYNIFRGLGNRDNFGPIIVPKKKYFMMGDNRDVSSDSRYWGFADHDDIVGKPIMVYFSYESDIPLSNLLNKIRWKRIGYFIQ